MASKKMVAIDGNEAAASVAHRTNEVIAIYPITPSSNMGEWADEWSALGRRNIWGTIPDVIEMQSEGGRLGRRPRGAAGRRADDDLHGVAGAAADDPRHVQDRRRALELLHARRRPHRGDARALDLRRPLRRDGLPADRLRAARLGLGPGSARHGPDRPGGDAALARPAPALLRRLPHLARGRQDRAADRRRPALHDPRRAGRGAPRARPDAGPSRPARHRAEPGRLLPGARGVQRLLRPLPRDRPADHGRLRQADRPRLPPVRLRRASRRPSAWSS